MCLLFNNKCTSGGLNPSMILARGSKCWCVCGCTRMCGLGLFLCFSWGASQDETMGLEGAVGGGGGGIGERVENRQITDF